MSKQKDEPAEALKPPVYRVGNSRLWIDDVAWEPGWEMTAIDKISEEQLAYFIKGGHLIRETEE